MKVFLDSVGCKLNQSEIEKYAGQFRSAGHILVSTQDEADVVIINTCAVTSAAAQELKAENTPCKPILDPKANHRHWLPGFTR